MSWYKTGTIAVTNGSKIITGTGTTWANALNGVSAGRMLLLPGSGTVQVYEIESVQNNTQLTLATVYTGSTATGLAYAIPTSPSVSIEQFANEFAATLAYYQQQLAGWQQILTGSGDVTLTTPDGETVTVRSLSQWNTDLSNTVTLNTDQTITGVKTIQRSGGSYSIWDTGNLVKQTALADETIGSVLLNGAHGLGGSAIQIADATDVIAYLYGKPSGFYRAGGSATNLPVAGVGWGFCVTRYDLTRSAVIAIQLSGATGVAGTVYYGHYNGSATAFIGWTAFPTLGTAQTFTGAKTFTGETNIDAIFRVRRSGATIGLVNTATADGTVGKSITFYNPASSFQILYDPSQSSATGRIVTTFPKTASGTVLVSNNNAVADSSGYWKTASPVVKIFADGTTELNAESEGVTVERQEEGVYKITGCLGMNADRAWGGDDGGIDIPVCRNKLPRLWVDYEVEEDGSLIIRTYHRTHPDAMSFAQNLIDSYSNGDPIDIPEDVFLMVRVQMPEAVVDMEGGETDEVEEVVVQPDSEGPSQ